MKRIDRKKTVRGYSFEKGRLFLLLGFLLCMTATFIGCGKKGPEEAQDATTEAEAVAAEEVAGAGTDDEASKESDQADEKMAQDAEKETAQEDQKEEESDNEEERAEQEPVAEEEKKDPIEEQYRDILLQYQDIQKRKLSQEEAEQSGITTELIQHGWPGACTEDEVKYLFYDIDDNGISELFITYYGDIVDIYAYNGDKVRYVFGNPYRGIAELYPNGMIAETFSYSASRWYTKWYKYDTYFADFFPSFEARNDDGNVTTYYEFAGVESEADRKEVEEIFKESGDYPVWVYEWFAEDTKEQYEQLCPTEPAIKLPEGKKIADFDASEKLSVKSGEGGITDEQALSAIKNYCYESNPDLKEMENSDDYTIYWEIVSKDESEIIVLYRSYTGAQIRYYIDPNTGDTYVTELVPGITEEEEKTGETFNIKKYL